MSSSARVRVRLELDLLVDLPSAAGPEEVTRLLRAKLRDLELYARSGTALVARVPDRALEVLEVNPGRYYEHPRDGRQEFVHPDGFGGEDFPIDLCGSRRSPR